MKLLPEGDVEFLAAMYPEIKFSLYRSDDETKFISCFVAQFEDEATCEKNWLNITNLIALNYQEPLDNEAAAWNIYLALVLPSTVVKNLKYRIENDRFALRKLVLDGPAYAKITELKLIDVLESAILGNDLKVSDSHQENTVETELDSANFVRDLVSKDSLIPVDGKDISIKIRKLLISELVLLGNGENENKESGY